MLLGGDAGPIGWSVQFLEAPLDRVLDAVVTLHAQHNRCRVASPRAFPDVLERLTPFEAPWTRELLLPCGGWTAYLNNFVNGGDPSAVGPAVSRNLGVRCVIAISSPKHGPGHQSTQLQVLGPDGVPPLMYRRTIVADAADGRWQWLTSGEPYDFEDVERYTSRRVRDRMDRALLLRYLDALGIPANDDSAYGKGVIVQQLVDFERRTVTLEEHRPELDLEAAGQARRSLLGRLRDRIA